MTDGNRVNDQIDRGIDDRHRVRALVGHICQSAVRGNGHAERGAPHDDVRRDCATYRIDHRDKASRQIVCDIQLFSIRCHGQQERLTANDRYSRREGVRRSINHQHRIIRSGSGCIDELSIGRDRDTERFAVPQRDRPSRDRVRCRVDDEELRGVGVTYARLLSGLIATPTVSNDVTWIEAVTAFVATSITDSRPQTSVVYACFPSGAIATCSRKQPTAIVPTTVLVAVRITETFPVALVTYAYLPFGVIAIPMGPNSTGTVAITVLSAASMTETVLSLSAPFTT